MNTFNVFNPFHVALLFNISDGIPPEPKPDSGLLSAWGHPLGVDAAAIISWYCKISNEILIPRLSKWCDFLVKQRF